MQEFQKIDDIRLPKLNNAEYANFSQRVSRLVQTATVEKLGIAPADLTAYTNNLSVLTDVVAQSRTSDHTVSIGDQDKECDDLIRYVFGTNDAGRKSPLAAQREAATSLYNLTKPYRGIQNLAQGQQIQQTRGLLTDLGKDEMAAAVDALALGAGIQALRRANNEYAALIDTRAAGQVATALPTGKAVRTQMDAQYDGLVTMAFVTSISTPSPEATAFVTAMNKLIGDTETAYNQRMGQAKAGKEKKETQTKDTDLI